MSNHRVHKRRTAVLLTVPLVALLLIAAAAEVEFFGFLDNPEQLQPSPQWGFDSMYVAPGAFEAMARYDAVMIEQPEIFLERGEVFAVTQALLEALHRTHSLVAEVVEEFPDEPGFTFPQHAPAEV